MGIFCDRWRHSPTLSFCFSLVSSLTVGLCFSPLSVTLGRLINFHASSLSLSPGRKTVSPGGTLAYSLSWGGGLHLGEARMPVLSCWDSLLSWRRRRVEEEEENYRFSLTGGMTNRPFHFVSRHGGGSLVLCRLWGWGGCTYSPGPLTLLISF